MTDVVAVDWSGAKSGAARRIWLAHIRDGRLCELANGRSRAEVVEHLITLKAACPGGLFVGLDFSFSFPAWFVRQHGHATARELWDHVAREGEAWLAACQPPFWGKKGHRRPQTEAPLRQTEAQAVVGGIRAKSTFQIRGAGSVGTGSIRGMPYLALLQNAGFSIWPFDPPSPSTVVELYPRLCTGPVKKRSTEARADYLRRSPWPLSSDQLSQCIDSEDAFDAAISAFVMDAHAGDLRGLHPATDGPDALEGMIWDPNNIRA